MTDSRDLLRRQADWQRGLASLPWPEKIRMAERMREGLLALRRTAPPVASPSPSSGGRAPEAREGLAPETRGDDAGTGPADEAHASDASDAGRATPQTG